MLFPTLEVFLNVFASVVEYVEKLYKGVEAVEERHRHRYEVTLSVWITLYFVKLSSRVATEPAITKSTIYHADTSHLGDIKNNFLI